MTVETQCNRAQYIGNGLTTEFPVPFPVLRPEHLKLFLWADDHQTEVTGGYTVLGAGTSAVRVRLDKAPAAGSTLTILRRVPFIQPMALSNSGPFNPTTLEGSADNLAMQIQQLAEENERAIVFPEGLPGERPNYGLLAALGAEAAQARELARAEADRAQEAAAYAVGEAVETLRAAGQAAEKARDEAQDAAGRAADEAHAAAGAAHTAAEAAHTAAEAVRDELADLAANKLDAAVYEAEAPLRIKAKVCFASHHPVNDAQVTILEAYNIAAVTRRGTGRYTITFLEPLENANYCVAGMGSAANGRWLEYDSPATLSTSIPYYQQRNKTVNGFDIAGTAGQGFGDNVFTPATFIVV